MKAIHQIIYCEWVKGKDFYELAAAFDQTPHQINRHLEHYYTETLAKTGEAPFELDQFNHPNTACKHPEGYRSQQYDTDGCGYYTWTCYQCGWTTIDDMP